MEANHFDADVLIAGAGPVGLALATELTMRGHTAYIAEKNDRVGVQPRAKTTNIRTMTHMRRWGLASEMRVRSPLDADFPRDVTFRTGLFDKPIHTFHDAFCATPQRYDAFPEHAEFIPQYVVEGILADQVAAEQKANLAFGSKLLSFAQDSTGVTAEIEDVANGQIRQIRCRYLVGADGGRSSVRDKLGITMNGARDLMSCATLILRIPGLNDDPDLKRALFHWIISPEVASFIGPMDRGDLWYWSKVVDQHVSTEQLLEFVRRAIGREFPVEFVTRDDWVVHSLIAERYREDRAFLVGDACHLHSPFGGHGMNQGIGDAVDLGWKLSAALEGWGSEGLLDSYTIERQQAHRAIVDSATKNAASLSDDFANPDLMIDGTEGDEARYKCAQAIERLKKPEFQSLGLVLGSYYSNSPAIASEPGFVSPINISQYEPSARPGHLAPHVWIDQQTSLYDLFSSGFSLLRLGDAQEHAEAEIQNAAQERGIPLATVILKHPEIKKTYAADYALVRPDQYVGWRGDKLPEPEFLLNIMTGKSNHGSRPST